MSAPAIPTPACPRIRVEPVGVAMCDVLAALHKTAFAAEDRWSAAALAELMNVGGTQALLASSGPVAGASGPVGFVLLRVLDHDAEILTIAVSPCARRQGVGRALMMAAAVHSSQSGARRLFLEVAAGNAAASSLYATLGFTRIGLRRAYYPSGADAHVLACDLRTDASDPAMGER